MPDWSTEIRRRLETLRLDPTREAEIVEELAQHMDDRYQEALNAGRTPDDARESVIAELHEQDVLARELRSVEHRAPPSLALGGAAHGRLIEALWRDTRYALRTWRSRPTFALVAIFTFALAIGACVLIFSAVQGVIRRPLPYKDSDALVAIWGTAPEKGLPEVAQPLGMYAEYRDHTRTLSGLAAYSGAGATLSGIGDPERLDAAIVSRNFFPLIGVPMLLGRNFLDGEDGQNVAPTVVLGYSLWQRKFGGDSSIIGRAIQLDARPTTVVGVMPRGFDFPSGAEVWSPLYVDATSFNCWCWDMLGRMRPGITTNDVRRDMVHVVDQFNEKRKDVFRDYTPGSARFVVASLVERIVGDLARPLVVLFGAVILVLLIACANIANLILVRATARRQELALRTCLGASPRRIAAQLLTESVLLAVVGAAAGLVLAYWGIIVVRQLPIRQFPRIDHVALDLPVLVFAGGIAIAAGVLCGLIPAVRVSRDDLQDAVKSGTRGSSAGHVRRISNSFVVTQFALSLVLLVGAGLLLRSYRRLTHLDLGYRPENVFVGRVSLPYPKYDTATVVRAFYSALLDRVRAIPGVGIVATANRVPLTPGNPQNNIIAEGKEPKPGEPILVANVRNVTPGYFQAIGTPLLEGRDFLPSDDDRGPRVAIVDETLAKHFWSRESAIGKRLYYGGDTSANRWMTVVGVAKNVKHNRLDETPDLQIYEPYARVTTWQNYLVVRSTLPVSQIAPRIRDAVTASDPVVPFYDVHTMESAVASSLNIRRLVNLLLGAFAATALLLAAIGIYGVMSLGVTSRVREFGIRLALGAQTGDVRGLVMRDGLLLAGLGVLFGIAGASYLTRFLRKLLFGVEPVDWATFAAVAVVLVATALVASYLPAHRATKADPMLALRAE